MENCIYNGLTLVSLFNHQSEKSVQTEPSFLETYIVKDIFDTMKQQNFVKYECFERLNVREPINSIKLDKPVVEEFIPRNDTNNVELAFLEEQFKAHLNTLKPFEQSICTDGSLQVADRKNNKLEIKAKPPGTAEGKYIRVENKEKRYKCETCNKRFVNSSDFKRHLKIHTDEKLYICGVCNKGKFSYIYVRTFAYSITYSSAVQVSGVIQISLDIPEFTPAKNRILVHIVINILFRLEM